MKGCVCQLAKFSHFAQIWQVLRLLIYLKRHKVERLNIISSLKSRKKATFQFLFRGNFYQASSLNITSTKMLYFCIKVKQVLYAMYI